MYPWLKLVHLLAVLMLAVGDVGSLLVAIRARRATTVRETLALMQTHHFMVKVGIIPGAMGSLGTGVALTVFLGLSWAELWIAGSVAAWMASLAIGVGLLVPAETKAIREGQRLADAGIDQPTDDLRRFVGAPKVYLAEWTTVILLVAMMALMVVKP